MIEYYCDEYVLNAEKTQYVHCQNLAQWKLTRPYYSIVKSVCNGCLDRMREEGFDRDDYTITDLTLELTEVNKLVSEVHDEDNVNYHADVNLRYYSWVGIPQFGTTPTHYTIDAGGCARHEYSYKKPRNAQECIFSRSRSFKATNPTVAWRTLKRIQRVIERHGHIWYLSEYDAEDIARTVLKAYAKNRTGD